MYLRIHGTYIPTQKFESIEISALRDKKNLTNIKDVKNIYFAR